VSSERDPEDRPPALEAAAGPQPQKSRVGHLVDLVVAFKWHITVAAVLLVTGIVSAAVDLPSVPTWLLRYGSLGPLVSLATLVVLGPYVLAVVLWLVWKNRTPVVTADEEQQEVHADLHTRESLSQSIWSNGLPARQRESDLGAAYVALEDELPEEAPPQAPRAYDTPVTEEQPTWLQLMELDQYRDWQEVRVQLSESLRSVAEEKRDLLGSHMDTLRDEVNRLVVEVEDDVTHADVDDDLGSGWGVVEQDDDQEERGDGPRDANLPHRDAPDRARADGGDDRAD